MNKKKKNRKSEYSNEKNKEAPLEVIDPEEKLPETKQILPITEMDRPLVTVDEAKKMWKQYQDLINALMKIEDVVEIEGKLTIKKSGLNKVARFFGYSCEIIRAKKEEKEGIQNVWKYRKDGKKYLAYQGRPFVWKVWAKAIAPTGRFRVAGAACSSTERNFNNIEHDVLATAETRAKKRAIWELAGMGEIELSEPEEPKEKIETEIKIEKKEVSQKKAEIPPILEIYKPEIKADAKGSKIINPEMEATEKQKEFIRDQIKKLGEIGVKVQLDHRIEELNKASAWNLSQKLLRKIKEVEKVKV